MAEGPFATPKQMDTNPPGSKMAAKAFMNFLEAHREEIALHKAAKAAFDEAGLQKLPKVKALDAEFAELLTKKKAAYPEYRKARDEMQELVRAQKNVERFFAEEKTAQENEQAR